MTRRVVITGLGVVSPLGVGAETTWTRLVAGETGVVDGLGHCDEFVPTDVMSRKRVRRHDRYTHFALAATLEARAQAGWGDGLPYDPWRVAAIVGTCLGGMERYELGTLGVEREGLAGVDAFTLLSVLANSAPAAIALEVGSKGPAFAVNSACASGAHAIASAAELIARGAIDAAIAGGAEAAIRKLTLVGFDKLGARSPSGLARPFDRARDGMCVGEGAGMLVLEAEDMAAARGAVVLGEVLGYGTTTDAYHETLPDPSAAAAAQAIELALAGAGVDPGEVAHLNAHGTATLANDQCEAAAFHRVFNGRAAQIPVSSVKAAIGHTFGAAGGIEAVMTLMALRDRTAPPTINHDGGDLDVSVSAGTQALPDEGRLVGISTSFGFGGHNAALCLGTVA